jgi:prepilin-type processing-associated H-X9-DG protein
VYAGRQRDNRLGTLNSRIGYRHPNNTANVAFADGHVETLTSPQFPRAAGGTITISQAMEDNAPENPSVYANPERALGP